MGDALRTVVDGGGRPVTVNGLIRWFVSLAAFSMMVACGGVSRSPDAGHIDWGRADGPSVVDKAWDAWARGQGGALLRDMYRCVFYTGLVPPLEFMDSSGYPWNCRRGGDFGSPGSSLLAARLGYEVFDEAMVFEGALGAAQSRLDGHAPARRLGLRWAERAAPAVTNGEVHLSRRMKSSRSQTHADEPTLWPTGAVGPAEGLVIVLLLLELGDGTQAGRRLEGAPNTPVIELLRAQAAALDTTQPAADRRERLVRAWHGVRMLMPARAHFELAHLALEAGALAEAEAHFAVLTAETEPAPPVNLPSVMLSYPRLLSTHPPLNTPALKDLAAQIETARRGVPPASGPPVLGDR